MQESDCPPPVPSTNLKYNTVTGNTAGSQVFIVYENGRAYPDYLVRYYRGKRNPKQTPFKDKAEAMKRVREVNPDPDIGLLHPLPILDYRWVYMDKEWKPYKPADQAKIEGVYQASKKNAATPSKVQIKSDEWTYEVDIDKFCQINIDHSEHTERKINRELVQQALGAP